MTQQGFALESDLLSASYSFAFDAKIGMSGRQLLEFLATAVGPLDQYAFYDVGLAYAECDWKLGLRKIARSGFDHGRFLATIQVNADRRSDGVAIGFCAL